MTTRETVKPGVLTRTEAADYLRVSVRSIDYLAKDGELKRLKMGRKTLYRVSDLDALIDRKFAETPA